MARCGKKKVLNSSGAYSQMKDPKRLELESKISATLIEQLIPRWSGIYLSDEKESLPIFGPVADCEKIISRRKSTNVLTGEAGHAGSRIVFTKDNYGHRGTGCGGSGMTMCEAIDIVAGSLSCEKELKTSSCRSRANFITDGARIYLTERGDIQNYFALGEASSATSISSELKSGIGIKADHTLIIGRELVRIVAGLAQGVEGGARLVNQNEIPKPRIEIAASDDSNAQPAVLGDSLIDHLESIKDEFMKVYEKIQGIESQLIENKYLLATHFHSGAGIGYIQTFPDPVIVSDAMSSLGGYLNNTREKIIDTFNRELIDLKAMGMRDHAKRMKILAPSAGLGILSNTVFIGL